MTNGGPAHAALISPTGVPELQTPKENEASAEATDRPALGVRSTSVTGLRRVECADCEALLDEAPELAVERRQPCSKCGSLERRVFVNVVDTVEVHEKIAVKAKTPGEKRPFMEQKTGDEYWRDGEKWVDRHVIVDRRGNRYVERVTDPATGHVIHYVDEPLSEHRGHGDAKRKRPVD